MDDSTIVDLFLERNEAAIGAVKEKYGAAPDGKMFTP